MFCGFGETGEWILVKG